MAMKWNPAQKLFWLALLFGGVLGSPIAAASGAGQLRLVVFGDSLSDTGNAFALTGQQSTAPFLPIPDAPYAIGGHQFTNGETWVEELAKKLGTTAMPVFFNPRHSNYAVGGARANGPRPVDLAGQVSLYLSQYAGADPSALHVIMIGGNDIRDALEALAADPSGASSFAIIGDAVAAAGATVAALVQAGASDLLVVGAPDMGLIPAVTSQGPGAVYFARLLSFSYNQGLNAALDGLDNQFGTQTRRFDFFAFSNQMATYPHLYGLSNVSDSCITPGVVAGALCNHPNEYMFWDSIHPTRVTHRHIGKEVLKQFQ